MLYIQTLHIIILFFNNIFVFIYTCNNSLVFFSVYFTYHNYPIFDDINTCNNKKRIEKENERRNKQPRQHIKIVLLKTSLFETYVLYIKLMLVYLNIIFVLSLTIPAWLQKEIHLNKTKKEEEMAGWEKMWSSNGGLQPGQAFDASKPLPFISTMFEMDLIPKGKGIVPGCGRGYAPRALSYGGRHCIGLDIAPTAVAAAKEYLKSNPPSDTNSKVEFKHGSFFEYKDNDGDNSFDFAYDYTFLCALQPDMREQWASTYARLLKPDGVLMTVVFPITGMFFYSLSLSLLFYILIYVVLQKTRH